MPEKMSSILNMPMESEEHNLGSELHMQVMKKVN
jgi:hypothetical protein